MILDPLPQGSYILRTSDGRFLERRALGAVAGSATVRVAGNMFWPDRREANLFVKQFSAVNTALDVHVYVVQGPFPEFVETWHGGRRLIPSAWREYADSRKSG